jgi:hypothetical protein
MPRIGASTGQRPNIMGMRRLTIQSVKNHVIGSWWSLNHPIPAETKAQALVAIEQELSRLPVDQLPGSELVAIAEGIRDRSESEADVQVRVDDLLSQHLAPIHSKRRAQARQQLIDHAVAYAKQEVASEEED